ncbi:hypothetical protein F2Q69_00062388 [Brassica cretica]|uniref:Uncharacterized protein n=1 Tax=Brassica cretica TaxID=69181 RepID=A0A8S9RJG0_BRACR|nr:hypothetical protein F2Q69_00062388 [Brassica cretica]
MGQSPTRTEPNTKQKLKSKTTYCIYKTLWTFSPLEKNHRRSKTTYVRHTNLKHASIQRASTSSGRSHVGALPKRRKIGERPTKQSSRTAITQPDHRFRKATVFDRSKRTTIFLVEGEKGFRGLERKSMEQGESRNNDQTKLGKPR